ncbi:MAG: MBL fold metallo-hydrolase [Syntrophaceae bacterium]
MGNIEVCFLGSGDAFGSGGRLQSCILLKTGKQQLLLDCGASALTGMARFGADPNEIDVIVISHLHGDHYGGIPFLINGSQLMFKRERPLKIIGPPGMEKMLIRAADALFPGSWGRETRFSLSISEFEAGREIGTGDVRITPYVNYHPQVDNSFALRITSGGKTIAYSSDTEWTDSLLSAARDADLFIAEAYFYEKKVKGHMDFKTLSGNFGKTGAKRLVLTHMGRDMLAMLTELDKTFCEGADDGKVLIV